MTVVYAEIMVVIHFAIIAHQLSWKFIKSSHRWVVAQDVISRFQDRLALYDAN